MTVHFTQPTLLSVEMGESSTLRYVTRDLIKLVTGWGAMTTAMGLSMGGSAKVVTLKQHPHALRCVGTQRYPPMKTVRTETHRMAMVVTLSASLRLDGITLKHQSVMAT